jgi:hypothetical protein
MDENNPKSKFRTASLFAALTVETNILKTAAKRNCSLFYHAWTGGTAARR